MTNLSVDLTVPPSAPSPGLSHATSVESLSSKCSTERTSIYSCPEKDMDDDELEESSGSNNGVSLTETTSSRVVAPPKRSDTIASTISEPVPLRTPATPPVVLRFSSPPPVEIDEPSEADVASEIPLPHSPTPQSPVESRSSSPSPSVTSLPTVSRIPTPVASEQDESRSSSPSPSMTSLPTVSRIPTPVASEKEEEQELEQSEETEKSEKPKDSEQQESEKPEEPKEPEPEPEPEPVQPDIPNPFGETESRAAKLWRHRKLVKNESNDIIDEVMRLQGLEDVKMTFLKMLDKVNVCKRQGRSLKKERFNIVFQGNPGTGKTTVARLYAKFLHSVGILESNEFQETSGMHLALEGVNGCKSTIESLIRYGGGVLFVDEAYQLTAPYMDGIGRQLIDIILTAMENHIGKFAAIFVGYRDEMEPFFKHNPGLSSRIPYTMSFDDFSDGELWKIMYDNVFAEYKGKMKIEGGMEGLYMRIAIRRLAQSRGGNRSFGNARSVQNLLALISTRQAERLGKMMYEGEEEPDPFIFTKEDIIGPRPYSAAATSKGWAKLKTLIGLEDVKKSVRATLDMIQHNYSRELQEKEPLRMSLNQVFVGNPGTGKTTVAELYGKIMADLGLLSNGEVVLKTPADFIGECLGKSEAKTKELLQSTVGKVLLIDEAYMLDAGDAQKEQDKFKTGVIDTIVSMVQGCSGEDRCIIMIGYEEKIMDMFHNVNPGLTRRFPVDKPFRFPNFSLDQLQEVLKLKMKAQDLECSPKAIEVTRQIFERALMRPNFTNAGEVDHLLATAKTNYSKRLSNLNKFDMDDELDADGSFGTDDAVHFHNGVLEAEDFDEDFARASCTIENTREALKGKVNNSIIEKLVSYHHRYVGAEKYGLNPRDQVPFYFAFKGYAGTGKTTTAQQMGKLYYDMGLLSSKTVVECSATDLLGQYVGQTAPRTRKVLEKALGKVLLIDEAYRLIHGQYAAEAVDELTQFLSKESNRGRIVVILACYTNEMNFLMRLRCDLACLFSEDVLFNNLEPVECLSLLKRELEKYKVVCEKDFLAEKTNPAYTKVARMFKILRNLPSWSNARDVQNLAKTLLGRFLESAGSRPAGQSQALTLPAKMVMESMSRLIKERIKPDVTVIAPSPDILMGGDGCAVAEGFGAPPPPADAAICNPSVSNNYSSATGADFQPNPLTRIRTDDKMNSAEGSQAARHRNKIPESEMKELQRARVAQEEELNRREDRKYEVEKELKDIETALNDCNNGDDRNNLTARWNSRKRELTRIDREMKDYERVQKALRKMTTCSVGYVWVRVLGGYKCEAGVCFISDERLRASMR